MKSEDLQNTVLAVPGCLTSAFLEAAVVDRPVHTILTPEFAEIRFTPSGAATLLTIRIDGRQYVAFDNVVAEDDAHRVFRSEVFDE